MQMNFVAGRDLQNPGFHLDKALRREPVADSPGDRRALAEERPAVLVTVLIPPGRGLRRNRHQQNRLSKLSLGLLGLASAGQISMLRPETAPTAVRAPSRARRRPLTLGN